MTLLPFLAVTLGGGALALLGRRDERSSTLIALAALAGASMIGATILVSGSATIGQSVLVVTDYARLFLVLGAVAGLGVTLIGAVTSMPRDLPATILLGLGAAGVALASTDPLVGILAAAAGSTAGVLVTLAPPRSAAATGVAARQLRALAVGTGLALLAAAWTARPHGVLAAEPEVVGLALLAIAAAVAIRLGAIPFHRWTAGLAANSAELALTVALVWGGALFALVLLAMTALSVEPLGASLGVERAVIVTAGVVTLILGVAAAYIHEDIAHIVTYSIVADAGIVLLAFGALDAGSWGAIRLWLLGFVLTRTAFAAWAAAIRSAFGTRRLRDLGGWARRAPLLALAVVVIAVVTIGWPGFALFDARSAVVASATGGPFTAIVLIGTLAHVGYFGRILAAGIGRRSSAVAGGMGPWPSWPARGVRLMPSDAERLWTANRAPIAAALVLALAMLSLLVSAGGLDGPRAAAGPAPRVTPSPSASPTPSPTPRPLPTGRPTATPTPVESPSEPATGSPAPGDGSASPSSGNPSGSPVSPSP